MCFCLFSPSLFDASNFVDKLTTNLTFDEHLSQPKHEFVINPIVRFPEKGKEFLVLHMCHIKTPQCLEKRETLILIRKTDQWTGLIELHGSDFHV